MDVGCDRTRPAVARVRRPASASGVFHLSIVQPKACFRFCLVSALIVVAFQAGSFVGHAHPALLALADGQRQRRAGL